MNIHVPTSQFNRTTRAAEGLPRWRWTTAELDHLVGLGVFRADEQFELIGGEIVPMLPAGRPHEVMKEDLAEYLHSLAPKDVKVRTEQQLNLDASTYTKPDVLVRRAGTKSYDVDGTTVLLVVEIAESSLDYDTNTKARLYALFGVREYWVIDTKTRSTRVHRKPAAGGYSDVFEVSSEELVTPMLIPAMTVKMSDVDAD